MKKTLFGNYKAKSVEQQLETIKKDLLNQIAEKDCKIKILSEKCEKYDQQITEIGEAMVYAKSFIVHSRQQLAEEEKQIRAEMYANHEILKESIKEEIEALIKKRADLEKEFIDFQTMVNENIQHFNSLLKNNDPVTSLQNLNIISSEEEIKEKIFKNHFQVI